MKHVKIFERIEISLDYDKYNLDDKFFFIISQDLYIFSEEEYKKDKLFIKFNNIVNSELLTSSIKSFWKLLEFRFELLFGKFENNNIVVYGNYDFRHSDHSPDLKKLYKQFNLPIIFSTFDKKFIIPININDLKISERIFYHGTSFEYIDDILRFGLMKNKKYNFDDKGARFNDKIFITMNLEKAEFHALKTAKNTKSFPVVIAFYVPDPDKLIPDYDLAINAYNKDSELLKMYGYKSVYESIEYDTNRDITNKIGLYGYLGRIPSIFITEVLYDEETYEKQGKLSDIKNILNWTSIPIIN